MLGMTNAVLIAVIIYFIIGFATISLVSPVRGEATDDRRPALGWFGFQGYYTVMIDDDPSFTSPVIMETGKNSARPENDLDFGKYYWKVKSNGIESATGEFSVVSTVQLSRSREEVKNTGNTNIWLNSITGAFVLGVNESVDVNEEENVTAEQY